MGAFIAGVMLAESSYRHELEADIEPFRGILLGLFFMAVGLSLDLSVIADNIADHPCRRACADDLKALVIYGACRAFGSSHNTSVQIAGASAAGRRIRIRDFQHRGGGGHFRQSTASLLVAIVTISMALTPLAACAGQSLMHEASTDQMDEDFEGAGSDVLMVGFSRFGQIASQILLAGGSDVTIIDQSADRIRSASKFGFKIYFGDGTRKDVLLAAGIQRAKIVAVCTHKKEITDKIVDMIQADFPNARIMRAPMTGPYPVAAEPAAWTTRPVRPSSPACCSDARRSRLWAPRKTGHCPSARMCATATKSGLPSRRSRVCSAGGKNCIRDRSRRSRCQTQARSPNGSTQTG
jgi:CPA2 family monovalent cation:H+ antiporter-2